MTSASSTILERTPRSGVQRHLCVGLIAERRRIELAKLNDPLGVQPTALKLYKNLERGLKQIEKAMLRAVKDEAITVLAARQPEFGELGGAPDEAAEKSELFYGALAAVFLLEAGADDGYIEASTRAAYQLGQTAAFEETATTRKIRAEIRRLPSNKTIVRAASKQTLDLVTAMSDDTRKLVGKEIADSLLKRESKEKLAARLEKKFKLARNRAAAIAQTESVRANAKGSLNTYRAMRFDRVRAKVEYTLNVHGSSAPCPRCIELEGNVYTLDEAEGIIPLHPRCQSIVSKGLISGSQIRKGYRREYSGDLLTLRAFSGHQTTVTANHPVLTDKGFIPARQLSPLEHRIAYGLPVESAAGDEQHEPVRADDAFQALLLRPNLVLSQVPIAAPDFHGDGADGDVDVVWAYRDLLAYRYAAAAEIVGQLLLGADVRLSLLDQARPLRQQLRRLALSSPRPLCRVKGLAAALGPLALIAELLRLARSADADTGTAQPLAYGPVVEAAALRQRQDRIASLVGGNLIRFSGFELSSVVAHHETVYDFQTANAMYCADGVVVSNCGWSPVLLV